MMQQLLKFNRCALSFENLNICNEIALEDLKSSKILSKINLSFRHIDDKLIFDKIFFRIDLRAQIDCI